MVFRGVNLFSSPHISGSPRPKLFLPLLGGLRFVPSSEINFSVFSTYLSFDYGFDHCCCYPHHACCLLDPFRIIHTDHYPTFRIHTFLSPKILHSICTVFFIFYPLLSDSCYSSLLSSSPRHYLTKHHPFSLALSYYYFHLYKLFEYAI